MLQRLCDSKRWHSALSVMGLVMVFAWNALAADDFGVTIVPRQSAAKPVSSKASTPRHTGSLVVIPENSAMQTGDDSFRVDSKTGWHRSRPVNPQPVNPQPVTNSTPVQPAAKLPTERKQPTWSELPRSTDTYVRPVAANGNDLPPPRPRAELAPPPLPLGPRQQMPRHHAIPRPPLRADIPPRRPAEEPVVDAPPPLEIDQPRRIPIEM